MLQDMAISYGKVDVLVEELKEDFNVSPFEPDLGCVAEGYEKGYGVRATISSWYLGSILICDYRKEAIFRINKIAKAVAARNNPELRRIFDDVENMVARCNP